MIILIIFKKVSRIHRLKAFYSGHCTLPDEGNVLVSLTEF